MDFSQQKQPIENLFDFLIQAFKKQQIKPKKKRFLYLSQTE